MLAPNSLNEKGMVYPVSIIEQIGILVKLLESENKISVSPELREIVGKAFSCQSLRRRTLEVEALFMLGISE